MTRFLTVGVLVLALAVNGRGETPAKADATKADPAKAGLDKVKKLVGTWVEADKDGKPTDKVVSIVKLTAGGSAVHETFFPGSDMEMVSLYHMDKGDLIMTHYCMLGNQPKMKADPKSAANTIKWEFAGGTNLDPKKDTHMHSSTMKFVDDDHLEIEGEAWADGKISKDHCGTMKLVRKK